MNIPELNFKPGKRQIAVRYPQFYKYKPGTELLLGKSGEDKEMRDMIHRPHQVIAIGEEASANLGVGKGDYVYLHPHAVNPQQGMSMLLELDIQLLVFDHNYVIGSAIYNEPYEKEDEARIVELQRQLKIDVQKGKILPPSV